MKVILVCLENFQEYILDNIKQLNLFGNRDIVVITNARFFPLFAEFPDVVLVDCQTLNDYQYNTQSRIQDNFRNGFWHLCSLRFFYLYAYMQQHQQQQVIHLENDVLCYTCLDTLKEKWTEEKVYATFDCDTRVIPGFLYIANAKALEPIIRQYDVSQNDMVNLARFDESVIVPLPIFIPPPKNDLKQPNPKYNRLYSHFECVFDAAAIGQYLGGVDPRNQAGDTRGFVNETCLVDYSQCCFGWIQNKEGLFQPHLYYKDAIVPIVNLHIHSKQLHRFLSNAPLECQTIVKIVKDTTMKP